MATAKTAAAAARKAEAQEDVAPITFTYSDAEYTIEPERLNNLELFEAIEDGRYITATKGFLGDTQWAAFKEANRTEDGRVPMEALEGLLTALMKAVGSGN